MGSTSTPINKDHHHHHYHHEHDVNLLVGRRLREIKEELLFKLTFPSPTQEEKRKEEECSGRTSATASSSCMSQEEVDKSFDFEMETTQLSPRIMMFYHDDDRKEEEEEEEE